jgi:hypothetical protein
MKARELVGLKVEEDLIGKGEGSGKMEDYKSERFDIFMGLVLANLNSSIDANKFEDYSRCLLGSRAYLLFSFDKLITAVSANPLTKVDSEANPESHQ